MRFVKIEEQFGRSRYSLPWGGEHSKSTMCKPAWPEVFKVDPNEDLPFWGNNTPTYKFSTVLQPNFPPLTRFYLKVTPKQDWIWSKKWPFFFKRIFFNPLLWFSKIAFILKKLPFFFRVSVVMHVYTLQTGVPSPWPLWYFFTRLMHEKEHLLTTTHLHHQQFWQTWIFTLQTPIFPHRCLPTPPKKILVLPLTIYIASLHRKMKEKKCVMGRLDNIVCLLPNQA